AHPGPVLADVRLQRVIAGVRTRGHDHFRAEPANGMARRVELSVGRKGWVRAPITVRGEDAGKMDSHGGDIGGAQPYASDFLIDAQCVRGDIAVAETRIEADGRE